MATATSPSILTICPRCWGHKQPFCDKCGNRGKLPDVQLSKNFFLSEFTASPTATRLRIQNDVTRKELERGIAMCKGILQPMRDALGPVHVTSGFRSEALGRAIGGNLKGAHPEFEAADCQFEKVTLLEAMEWFRTTELPFDQAILEYGKRPDDTKDDWVHVGFRHPSGVQRRQLLLIRPGQKAVTWKP